MLHYNEDNGIAKKISDDSKAVLKPEEENIKNMLKLLKDINVYKLM